MKFSLVLLLFCISVPCIAAPRADRSMVHDRHPHDIFRITEHRRDPPITSPGGRYIYSERQIEISELKNGLYLVTGNHAGVGVHYNLYHNIRSEIRLLTIVTMNKEKIYFAESRIEIFGTRVRMIRNENRTPGWAVERIKVAFEFDMFNRTNGYSIVNLENNNIEEYLFRFNEDGLLAAIYSVNDWGNVLIKSVYYDGQLRILERPFFDNVDKINLEEIVVLENNKIKYHAKRFIYFGVGSIQPRLAEDWLTNDTYHLSYLIEFNEHGRQIRQIVFSRSGNRLETAVEYLQYDDRGNWIFKRVGRTEYRRKIEYRQ